MFTGIIEHLGTIDSLKLHSEGGKLTIHAPTVAPHLAVANSIAVDGCCLTVVELEGERLSADLSTETIRKTSMREWKRGTRVNLEQPMTAGKEFGGHFVLGHVDTIGRVTRLDAEGENWWYGVEVPELFAKSDWECRPVNVCRSDGRVGAGECHEPGLGAIAGDQGAASTFARRPRPNSMRPAPTSRFVGRGPGPVRGFVGRGPGPVRDVIHRQAGAPWHTGCQPPEGARRRDAVEAEAVMHARKSPVGRCSTGGGAACPHGAPRNRTRPSVGVA